MNHSSSQTPTRKSRYNHSRSSRKRIPNHAGAQPFKLRVHSQVKRLLDRINVPEPREFKPDPFQTEAIDAIDEADVLVTAPTGAGKTYVAVKAIERVFRRGRRSWYASPLKALSNAKFHEFCELFGAENIGILTGDRKENVNAPIIVGTTEILRNQLYDAMHRGEDLDMELVVLDEAHYLGDEDRGVVWEEVLIYLPSRVRILLLSATIRNARHICQWLKWLRHSPCRWVAAEERPVPLYPLFLFPDGRLTPLSTRKGLYPPIRELDRRQFSRRSFPPISNLLATLRQANLLPAIFFLKSRADCERAIELCSPPTGKNDEPKHRRFLARLDELLETWPFLKTHRHLAILRKARVGAHHGGQLPHWKLLLERLMQEGYLEAIFSTSTVAAGVNFPARTVVILQSDRFNGREFVDISATDLLQMTGRAGRRGMDDIGFVLIVPGFFQNAQLIHDLLQSPPDAIHSQLRINFSMVLNLLLSHQLEEIRLLFSSSFATYTHLGEEKGIERRFKRLREAFEPWLKQMACGGLEALAHVRPGYLLAREQHRKLNKTLKQNARSGSLTRALTTGQVFVTKRNALYIALDDADPETERVVAVRLRTPLTWKRRMVHSKSVRLRTIAGLGERIERLPHLRDRKGWHKLARDLEEKPFQPQASAPAQGPVAAMGSLTEELRRLTLHQASMPCSNCELHGPCLKMTNHPFSRLIQRYFTQAHRIHSIQEELWRSFQRYYRFLQEEGYIDSDGRLTSDGLWASKLRLDQPILISEGIRHGVFPANDPALLAALVAPFVMDRERPREAELSAMAWRFPDLAGPYFKLIKTLERVKGHLQAEGFPLPPLPFWTVVTLYHWARGESWDAVARLTGIDEGDLAMVILRTADHLRQIESLAEIPELVPLARSASQAIKTILREPVLVT